MLQAVWASRSFTMASLVVSRLFPAPLVDEELAAMARAWLDANPSPAPLHRLVSEQLDELERALAARARDASELTGRGSVDFHSMFCADRAHVPPTEGRR